MFQNDVLTLDTTVGFTVLKKAIYRTLLSRESQNLWNWIHTFSFSCELKRKVLKTILLANLIFFFFFTTL